MTTRRQALAPTSLVIAGGVLLLLVAGAHHWGETLTLNQSAGPLAAFVLDGGLAVAIVAAGYWLSTTELDAEERWMVASWGVAGGGLFVAVTGLTSLIRIYEGRPISEPTFPLLIAAEAGTLAGLVAGHNTARLRRAADQAREVNAELERLNRELEASNERLEQFAHTLSHDLREPLRMVTSYMELLETRYADELDEDAREFIEYASDGAARMQLMVEGLLEYARVTSNEAPLAPTDANDVLESVLDDLQFRIEETGATVTTADLPTVRADEAQLTQVLQNLLENALRHSGEAPPRVHVGSERTDGMWQFSVRDDGVGIDPDRQERIFDLFEQGDRSSGSSGIGLALCERIVAQHGGDIWVESEPDEGATFRFTLPPADDATTGDATADDATADDATADDRRTETH